MHIQHTALSGMRGLPDLLLQPSPHRLEGQPESLPFDLDRRFDRRSVLRLDLGRLGWPRRRDGQAHELPGAHAFGDAHPRPPAAAGPLHQARNDGGGPRPGHRAAVAAQEGTLEEGHQVAVGLGLVAGFHPDPARVALPGVRGQQPQHAVQRRGPARALIQELEAGGMGCAPLAEGGGRPRVEAACQGEVEGVFHPEPP